MGKGEISDGQLLSQKTILPVPDKQVIVTTTRYKLTRLCEAKSAYERLVAEAKALNNMCLRRAS